MELAVSQMIVLDYLIANEDRHQNNFGLIRNANTLEWIGPAPIFDSGSSMGYDKLHYYTAFSSKIQPFKSLFTLLMSNRSRQQSLLIRLIFLREIQLDILRNVIPR